MTEPKIIDYRSRVPRKTGSGFARRRLENIKGVVFHQALGNGTVDAIARYHTSAECHIAPGKGAPSICYTYYIHADGTIYWCNDLEAVTWSQGSGTAPIPGTKGNTNYLAVCFQGDFSGEGHEGASSGPTADQMEAASKLWYWLRNKLNLAPDALYGHHDFGKPACPGYALSSCIEKLRLIGRELAMLTPVTVTQWQQALIKLGYDLGKAGADNFWGPKTHAAVMQFQRDRGLPVTGRQDMPTATALGKALMALPKPEPTVELEPEPAVEAPKRGKSRGSSPSQ